MRHKGEKVFFRKKLVREGYSFTRAALTQDHKLCGFYNRNVLSHSSEDRSLRSRC